MRSLMVKPMFLKLARGRWPRGDPVRAILTRVFFVLCLVVPAIVTIGCGSSYSAQSTTTGTTAQTITFGALPGVTDGVAPITLTATASSGLPVSYAVTGPATVSGSTLTVTGAGSVTVTASQAGNSTCLLPPRLSRKRSR